MRTTTIRSSFIVRPLIFFLGEEGTDRVLDAVDSGHGAQIRDIDGDEIDGLDEVIYPVDYETAGHIVDDVRTAFLSGFRDLANSQVGCAGDTCGDGERIADRVSLDGMCALSYKEESEC